MNKLIKRLILIAVCLLPTLMAVIAYMNAQESPLPTSEVSSLIWEGPSGRQCEFVASAKEDADFIAFLLQLNQNADPVEKLPADLSDDSAYRAAFVTDGKKTVYTYYFSNVSPSNSYLTGPDEQVYRIDAADTISFLDSDHSAELYPASEMPVLTVAGECLNAASVSWTYYTYSGKAHELTGENPDVPTYVASYTGITLSSSRIPDSSLLIITDDSQQVLYKGSLAGYNASTTLKKLIRKDTLLHFSLEADWARREGAKYNGNARFCFDVQTIFDPTANFWLGKTSVELGEFVVLSGEFVEELSDLTFASSPSIGVKPTFIRDGDLVRALVPIPRDLSAGAGEYTFTVTCQGKEYPLTLNVTEPTHSSTIKCYNYSGKVNTAVRTEANLAAFRDLMASLPVTSTLYADKFVIRTYEGARAQYGQIIHNTNREEDQFRSNGLAFVAYAGTEIKSVGNGMVVAVTTTAYGGNTIVVDHGWGLYSIYYCLHSTEVEVGAYVTSESVIGKGGWQGASAGYTDGITCYCELWVGGQPVSYYPAETEGVVIGTPN